MFFFHQVDAQTLPGDCKSVEYQFSIQIKLTVKYI